MNSVTHLIVAAALATAGAANAEWPAGIDREVASKPGVGGDRLLLASNAASRDQMLDKCARAGQKFFREPTARTEMRYNGQRTDRTHAVGGEIFLENRAAHFSCSFRPNGHQIVDFVADGRSHNEFLASHGEHHGGNERSQESDYVTVHGVPQNDVLNVRSGPSAQSRIVGALANGDRVRNLGCRNEGGSRWCRIQMLDDMKSEGWVNDRYLKESGAPAGSRGNIDHGGRIENNCAAAVAKEVGVSANDVMVTNSTISEGTGRHVVYVGVPYGKADWICEADRNGRVVNVFYSGE